MLKRLVRGSLRQFGLSIARGDPRAENAVLQHELAQTRQELDSAQKQLAEVPMVVRHTSSVASEETLVDPPPRKRLKDDPTVYAAVKAHLARAGLPETVNQILLDPEFSVEDRSRYMKLFHHVGPELYDRTAAAIAIMVNGQYLRYQPRYHDPVKIREQAQTLRREGLLRLPSMLTKDQIREIQDYFLKRPIYNGHTPMSARHRSLRRYVNYTAENYPLGSYSKQEIALAPHILEMALNPLILDTAAAYFGCAPKLTWLQSWWNFAGPGDYPHRQNYFHRDTNDFGMFWVYIYLTDVDETSGPHKLIRRSADFALLRERYERAKADPARAALMDGVEYTDVSGTGHTLADEIKESIFDGLTETLTGPAGTAFITRGVDLHKVATPLARKRQILAARFCINEFQYPAVDRDGDQVPGEVAAERVGSDEQLRYITQLPFDWSHDRW
jgi:hypothetical protein